MSNILGEVKDQESEKTKKKEEKGKKEQTNFKRSLKLAVSKEKTQIGANIKNYV